MWLLSSSLLLGALLLLAFRRGGQPERVVAATFALAFTLGLLALLLRGPSDYRHFDIWRFGIEVLVLTVVMGTAIRANRWWPICVSALQLIVVTTQLLKLFEVRGAFGIFWAMTTIPTYLQWLVLVAGIVAHSYRTKHIGTYRDWRIA